MHDDTCKVLYLHVLCAIMELFQIRSMASEAWATITKREKWNRSYREVKIYSLSSSSFFQESTVINN